MKIKLFLTAALAVAVLAGTSCSKPEQSQLSLDSIQQTATVQSMVFYSTGVDVDAQSDYTIENKKPAIGRKVYLEVAYSEYTPSASGTKIYETVTDSTGCFQLQVPTTSDGISATLRLEEFTDVYNEYERMEAGQPVFKTTIRNYAFSCTLSGLKPGTKADVDEITYDNNVLNTEAFDEKVTLQGSLKLATELGFRQGAFKAAEKADVEFTVIYNRGTSNQLKLTFGTTTDAEGKYTLNVPVQSLREGFYIEKIKVMGVGENAFVHYTSVGETEQLYGAYESQNVATNVTMDNIIDGITYQLGTKYLMFTPYYNAGITATSAPDTWEENLAGWAAGMNGFDESYTKTATLTGTVHMAAQTSYGIGTYKTEAQAITISGPWPYSGLVAYTDADGKFSVEIPYKTEFTPGVFTASLAEPVQPFTFYTHKGEEVLLTDGEYVDGGSLLPENGKWYELGDIYLDYSPASANTPDDWVPYLAGWMVSSYKYRHAVTGQLFFAEETSFAQGSYEPAAGVLVPISYNTQIWYVLTGNDGSYTFEAPLADEKDQPTVSTYMVSYTTNEYVHYTEYGKSSTRELAGKYTHYVSVKDADAEWDDLGKSYYRFTPSNSVSTFHTNLAGWFVKDGFDEKATATGKVYKAVETSFGKGEFQPAAGQVVTVNVSTPYSATLQVLADANGQVQVEIPIKHAGDEPSVAVSASSESEENFVHYDMDKTRILEGYYTPDVLKDYDAAWNDLGQVYYKFTPDAGYTPDGWSTYFRYLAGWQKAVDYQQPVHITGRALFPVESGFRQGSYQAVANLPIKITNIPGFTAFVGFTDENGEFDITVYQKFAGDELTPSWNTANISTSDAGRFVHYRKAGSDVTELLEGYYNVSSTVKSASADWTSLGTRYYSFNNNTSDALNWSTNLPGWNIYAADEINTIIVKGSLKIASETYKISGGATASWAAGKYQMLTVKVDGTNYAVATDASGNYSFNLKVKNIPDNLTLSVSPNKVSDATIKHYEDPSKNASVTVDGYYYSANNIMYESVAKSGTTYQPATSAKMYFSPDVTPTGWSSYDWTTILSE